jgi:uncharacterized membrane protein
MTILKKILPFILIFFISFPTFKIFLTPGYFPMHDDLQIMRVYQMDKCVEDGQLPCRLSPDMGYGYGYPQFNFYAPLPYYLAEVVHLFGLNYFVAIKITFALSLILGNFFIFLLLKKIFPFWPSLVATVLYAYTPYRASDIFARGALNESWAFVFMPIIILSLVNLIEKPKLKNIFLMAISVAGLLLTHNVTSFFFIPLSFLWILIYAFFVRTTNFILKIKYIISGFFLALPLSAFFILPVIFEKKYVHVETLLGGYFDYRAHFISLKQLFGTSYWSYGSSILGPTDDFSFFVSIIALILFAVSLSLILFKKISLNAKAFTISSAILFLISVFMTHGKSAPLWKTIPTLPYLQFPWRFLIAANFFIALASAASISLLQKTTRAVISIILIILIFVFNASFFRPQSWFDINFVEKFSGTSYQKQATISIFDYLPKVATLPPADPAPYFPYSVSGQVSILNYQRNSYSFKFDTKSEQESVLQIPQFDFPGWQVYLNAKKVDHYPEGDLGLITFNLPAGEHKVKAIFKDTPVRTLGNLTSLFSIGVFIYFYIKTKKND